MSEDQEKLGTEILEEDAPKAYDVAAEQAAADAAYKTAKAGNVQSEEIEPTSPAEPARFAGKTEEEIAAAFNELQAIKTGYRSQIDALAGNYGKLNAMLTSMQSDKRAPEKLTDADMSQLIEEGWSEESIAVQRDILNKVIERSGGTRIIPADDSKINELVSARVLTEMIPVNENLLNTLRPDWKEVTKPDPNTDYRKWLATREDDYRNKIINSNNAFEIIGSIKAFESHRDEAQKQAKDKDQRLKNAIQPEGKVSAKGALTEQQAADAAWASAHQR